MASVEAPVRKRAKRQARPKAIPHPTPAERAAMGKAARAVAPRDRARRVGAGGRSALIRSSCWRSRRRPGCRSWCRSATGGCWCRRSRSSAARPTRWRPTWPARRGPGWTCSSAAMRTCRTSARSPRPIGGWCSASTTSTRRCRARSSGTSSGWWPASPSPAAIAASTPSSGSRSTWTVTRAYREAIRSFAGMSNLDLWYSRIDVDEIAASGGRSGSAASSASSSSATWPRRGRRTA